MGQLLWIAKLLVSVALLWWWLHAVSFAPVLDRAGEVQPFEVVLIIGIMGVQFVLFCVRWWLVSRCCAAAMPLSSAIRIGFISLFFNQTLPATVGGDIVRSYLASREGVPIHRAVVGVVVDRIIGSIALVGLVAMILPGFYSVVSDPIVRAGLAMIVLTGLLGSCLLVLAGGQIAAALKRWRVMRPLGVLTDDLRGALTQRRAIWTLALSFAIHLTSVGAVILSATAMGVRLDPMVALVLVPPVMLVVMIPISVAGWGVRESALIMALAQAGVTASDALAISLAFGLASLVASLPGGVLWLWSCRTPWLNSPALRESGNRTV